MARTLFSISTVFLLLQILLLAAPSLASGVSVVTPLDNQQPPVARVGQGYFWTISNNTFGGCKGSLDYSVADLPAWLSFDPSSQTLQGTPQASDEGDVDVTMTARGCGSSESSWCSIPVTSKPPPSLKTPISEQFKTSNPSLSSVFVVGPESVFAPSSPALRIPPKWSFSIGFEGDTYTGADNVYYTILQADGSEIPSWMRYNPQEFTLQGVTPHEDDIASPSYFQLVLHASDIKGATAATQAFEIIVCAHEVAMTKAVLPTINMTASSPFDISLNSAADFSGLMADDKPFQPEDLTDLIVTTTGYSWMSYDQSTRHLTGLAPANLDSHPVLPVKIATIFNQSIQTNLSIALVASFFSAENLPPIVLGDDGHVQVDFRSFFSNTTSTSSSDVDLGTSYDPKEAADVLKFDPQTTILSGDIPSNFSTKCINVTITAYSHITHSTSHASLSITFSPSAFKKEDIAPQHGSSSKKPSPKLIMGLSIAFGIIGGVIALGVCLSLFSRCARVEDTALGGEEGEKAWSEKDKKWYGLQKTYEDIEKSPVSQSQSPNVSATKKQPYGGLGLRRVLERSHSDLPSNASSSLQSPGVMSKREFMGRIRETVRNVSDKYSRRGRRPLNLNRPVIGKPILINSAPAAERTSPESVSNPFADSHLNASSFVTRNSTSTDHGSPRVPATVHFADGGGSRDSMASVNAHAAEAVVQTASRASVRSAMSMASDIQPSARPRLVPFTSATRVPIPNMSISSPDGSPASSMDHSQRIVSQTALVDGVRKSVSGDELSMGIHYVRALGADHHVGTAASTLTVSTNVRSSFSSLESSHHGHEDADAMDIVKMVARAGERFKFRVPVEPPSPASTSSSVRRLQARLMSGDSLPRFLHADLHGRKYAGAVELYGVPSAGDIGELDVGVFDGSVCVGRVYLEVIGR